MRERLADIRAGESAMSEVLFFYVEEPMKVPDEELDQSQFELNPSAPLLNPQNKRGKCIFWKKKHALTERSDFAAKPPTDVMKISFIQKNLSGERYLKKFDLS